MGPGPGAKRGKMKKKKADEKAADGNAKMSDAATQPVAQPAAQPVAQPADRSELRKKLRSKLAVQHLDRTALIGKSGLDCRGMPKRSKNRKAQADGQPVAPQQPALQSMET